MEFFKQNIIPGEVLVQLIAFLIVFFTLKALAWKPLLRSLEARRQRIKDELDRIDASQKEIEQLKADYKARFDQIQEEARKRLQEAIDEGKRIGRQLQEESRRESRAILEKAKEDIALEVAKAKVTLRGEIADLTLAATERLLREKLDETKDKEMVLDFIEELEKLK